MIKRLFVIGMLLITFSCQSSDSLPLNIEEAPVYFPPTNTNEWDTISPNELNWDMNNLHTLKDFLISQHTKSFIVLHKGKIVIEDYYNGHTATNTWQWNSAGKTLVAATTGIAQHHGLISIDNKVSDYIGNGWTSATTQQEDLIKVKHLLSMISGLNDIPQLVIAPNLTYVANAGTRWAYSNVFKKLMHVVEDASGVAFENYFNSELANKIGMEGFWHNGLIYSTYHSNARSMARFGLLAAENGNWDGVQIVDEAFFIESKTPSQNINPSYGYSWWLNGQASYMLPSTQTEFTGTLVPNAPTDMVAAMGKDDQRIYIIPSRDLVIIRMGAAALSDDDFALSAFDVAFWDTFNAVIN